jgi:hypothetical protein
MIEQIGGRKMVAVLVCVVIGVAAVFIKGDVPANFLSLVEFLFGAFVVGNGVEHAAGAYSAANSDGPMPDNSDVLARLNGLEEHLGATQQGVATVQQTLSFIIQKTGLSTK